MPPTRIPTVGNPPPTSESKGNLALEVGGTNPNPDPDLLPTYGVAPTNNPFPFRCLCVLQILLECLSVCWLAEGSRCLHAFL